jgi:DNA-dependent RNA polymerase auxiliary subunit epsilon
MSETGIIELTVKLYLETDVDAEQAREIVDEMNYDIKHPMIQDTEIIADDIEMRTS